MLPLLSAIAPIIGAGIGALGSLLAPKPKPVKNSIDLKGLRDDAEAAGFNPLTIIRGGGLAGYGITPAAPDTRLSNALMTFGSGIAAFNPMGVMRDQAELDLAKAQIKSLGSSGTGAGGNLSFQTPKAVGQAPDPMSIYGPGGLWVTGGWTPAQDVADMYGELVGDTTGVVNYGYDMLHKSALGPRGGNKIPVSWGPDGWKPDPNGTPSLIITGGGF